MREQAMRLFLSYASEDHQEAEEIDLALKGAGHKVFFDKSSLPPASDFHSRIRLGVKESDAMVFLITEHSVNEKAFTISELEYAKRKWPHPADRVLPVMLKPTPYGSIPAYLKGVNILEPRGNVAAAVVTAVSDLHSRTPKISRYLRPFAYALVAAAVILLAYFFYPRDQLTIHNKYSDEITVLVGGGRTVLRGNESTKVDAAREGTLMQLYSCGWGETRIGDAPPGCRWIPYTGYIGQVWVIVASPPAPRVVMRSPQSDGEIPPSSVTIVDLSMLFAALDSSRSELRRKSRKSLGEVLDEQANGKLTREVIARVAMPRATYYTKIGVTEAINELGRLSAQKAVIPLDDVPGAIADLNSARAGADEKLMSSISKALLVVNKAQNSQSP
jgi:hypothetical protein